MRPSLHSHSVEYFHSISILSVAITKKSLSPYLPAVYVRVPSSKAATQGPNLKKVNIAILGIDVRVFQSSGLNPLFRLEGEDPSCREGIKSSRVISDRVDAGSGVAVVDAGFDVGVAFVFWFVVYLIV